MGTHPFTALPAVVARIGKRVDRAMTRTVRETANEAQRVAVLNTRVDTGLARSNWVASLGAPFRAIIPAYRPYPKGSRIGKGERANAEAALQYGRQIIDTWRITDPRSIFIANNVDYIETLNNGRPNVSADLMLERASQAAIIKARKQFALSFRAAGIDRTLQF